MSGWEQFKRVVHRSTHVVCVLGMVFILPLMLMTTADVLSRSFLNKPLPGVVELSEYMLALVILLGAAYTQQVRGHVHVDFLTSHMGARTQSIISMFTTLLCLAIVSVVVWQGYMLGLDETSVSDMLRIPKAPFKFLVGIGGSLLWLELLIDLVDSVRKVAGRTV